MNTEENSVMRAIRQRRSIRKYLDERIPSDVIREVLDAGRWAPTGKNNQPCRFLVVMSDDPRREALAGCTKYTHIVNGAGTCIAVFLDKERMYHAMKDYQGAGACIQNMLLAIHSLGYGAVWLGEIVNQEPQVHEALGTDPGRYELMAVLAMGRPATEGHSTRLDFEEYLLEEF